MPEHGFGLRKVEHYWCSWGVGDHLPQNPNLSLARNWCVVSVVREWVCGWIFDITLTTHQFCCRNKTKHAKSRRLTWFGTSSWISVLQNKQQQGLRTAISQERKQRTRASASRGKGFSRTIATDALDVYEILTIMTEIREDLVLADSNTSEKGPYDQFILFGDS